MNLFRLIETIGIHDHDRVPAMSSHAAPPAFDRDAYLNRLAASRARVLDSKQLLIDWLCKLKAHGHLHLSALEPLFNAFPQQAGDDRLRLVYDIHRRDKRYGNLGIAMRSASMRTDLCRAEPDDLLPILKATVDARKVKQVAAALKALNLFNDRVAALRNFGIAFPSTEGDGTVIYRWLCALGTYGEMCVSRLEKAFDEFEALSDALDEAMFNFNTAMGNIRYRAIRCTYRIDDFDPLGPAKPSLVVVVSNNRLTQKRQYNEMVDFKKALKHKRIANGLKRELGRDPEKYEVQDAVRALRTRKETEWITREVIEACYFGRRKKQIFEAQENLVAIMQPWTYARNQLQALLP